MLSTLATADLLLFHAGALPELTAAVSFNDLPFLIVADDLLSEIVGDFTVISHSFVTPSRLAVIIAVPCLMAVTLPLLLTVATLFFFVFHVTLRPEDVFACRARLCFR